MKAITLYEKKKIVAYFLLIEKIVVPSDSETKDEVSTRTKRIRVRIVRCGEGSNRAPVGRRSWW